MGADAGAAVQAADVLLVLLRVFMQGATSEELLGVESLQPRWLPNSLLSESEKKDENQPIEVHSQK